MWNSGAETVTNGLTNGVNRWARRGCGLARGFVAARRGNVAMMFALALPVLVMVSFGAIDIHQASKVKANLQDALDAAALAAARSKYTDDVNLNRVGMAALKANMPAYFQDGTGDTASFTLEGNKIVADANVNVKVLVANIVLPPYGKLLDDYLPVGSTSEVLRASRNVEVAMALDITGSMAGSRLTDLKTAAKDLIDLVVQKEQTPFYSRVALVPYSMGVNVGSHADSVRGALQQATTVTAAGWADAAKTVSTISRQNPAVVTANSHGLETGDRVWLTGVSRMTDLNDRIYTVTRVSASQFRLNGVSTTGYSRDGTGGTVRKCWRSDCTVVVTSTGHTLSDGDFVRISGVQGMTNLNATFQATRIDANQFRVDLLGPNQANYSRGGSAQCGYDGCNERIFINRYDQLRTLPKSNCVSERAGAQAYTDAAPAVGQWIGRNYPDSNNSCLGSQISPLSSDIDSLKSKINGYTATGSTAGQIGIAWGWYMVSPSFGSLWGSADSRPADYEPSKTLKAVVLMTDGDFNTPYCQGVISRDAPSNGSAGRAEFQINCSDNGSPFAQSVAMCDAMKRENVVVYTVGFGLGTNRGGAGVDTAIEVMEACATSKDKHFFQANSGTDLKEAFKAIGRDITRLRIAR